MPATTDLSDEQVWDIVDFLEALPYPHMLPADIRRKVYGEGKEHKAE